MFLEDSSNLLVSNSPIYFPSLHLSTQPSFIVGSVVEALRMPLRSLLVVLLFVQLVMNDSGSEENIRNSYTTKKIWSCVILNTVATKL